MDDGSGRDELCVSVSLHQSLECIVYLGVSPVFVKPGLEAVDGGRIDNSGWQSIAHATSPRNRAASARQQLCLQISTYPDMHPSTNIEAIASPIEYHVFLSHRQYRSDIDATEQKLSQINKYLIASGGLPSILSAGQQP